MRRQSNDRFAIGLGVSLVALTFFLVLDIQTGLNLRRSYLPIPIEIESTDDVPAKPQRSLKEDDKSIFDDYDDQDSGNVNNFDTFSMLKHTISQQFTQIGKLRAFMGSKSSENDILNFGAFFNMAKDHFTELEEAIVYIEMVDSNNSTEVKDSPMLGQILSVELNENTTILDKFNYEIKQNELYAEHSETIEVLLQEMATRSIAHVEEKEGGTQIKMTMQYDNGMLSIAKPMRFPRDHQTLENHIMYADYERHTADIAAFHLDRLLGFRRAFPVTGRILNMTSEIFNICETKLRNTFFTSLQPYNNLCFYGTCHRYCDIYHPVCGSNGLIEASFIAFFPTHMGERLNYRTVHPWRKSYSQFRKAVWELDPKYCDKVKANPPYNKGRRLLDLIDMAIFDFLTGNMDRHHYEIFKVLGEEAFPIHYDNGRGFGRPFYDEHANLAPLVQCCMVRSSTLKTLLRFHNGPKPLSQLMKESMASDPVAPVLWQPHLMALDRRVSIILTALRHCIETHSIHDVVYAHDLQ